MEPHTGCRTRFRTTQTRRFPGSTTNEPWTPSILSAFRRLSIPDQEVLSLCDWAGLSYAEAALALGVPVGTVRSRLSRAREHLRASASEASGPADPITNHSKGTTP